MSTREMAFSLLEHLSESDLLMFLSIFGRLYPQDAASKKPENAASKKPENADSMLAFQELESLIERIPAFPVDEDATRDQYFKEKYGA